MKKSGDVLISELLHGIWVIDLDVRVGVLVFVQGLLKIL